MDDASYPMEDFTAFLHRKPLLHTAQQRPLPLGISLHLPSLFKGLGIGLAAGLAAFLVAAFLGVTTPLAVVCGFICLPIVWVAAYLLLYLLDLNTRTRRWLDWRRQPRRLLSQHSGGVEPDEFHHGVLLWRPVDTGWFARQNLARQRISGWLTAQRPSPAATHEEEKV